MYLIHHDRLNKKSINWWVLPLHSSKGYFQYRTLYELFLSSHKWEMKPSMRSAQWYTTARGNGCYGTHNAHSFGQHRRLTKLLIKAVNGNIPALRYYIGDICDQRNCSYSDGVSYPDIIGVIGGVTTWPRQTCSSFHHPFHVRLGNCKLHVAACLPHINWLFPQQ